MFHIKYINIKNALVPTNFYYTNLFIVPEWLPPSAMMTSSGVSFTNIQEPKSHQKFLREKKTNGSDQQPQPASLNPNRASYPGPATTITSTDLSAMSSSSTSSSGERLNGTDGKVCTMCDLHDFGLT